MTHIQKVFVALFAAVAFVVCGAAAYSAVSAPTAVVAACTPAPTVSADTTSQTFTVKCKVPKSPKPTATVTKTVTATPTPSVTPTPTVNPSPTVSPTSTPTGSFPDASTTGVPAGTVLSNYTGACSFSGAGTTTIDKKDITAKCGELIVYNGAKLVITNSKSPRLESTDDGAGKTLGSISVTDSDVSAPGYYEGVLWGYNITALRVDVTGGQHSFHCNSNCSVKDSFLHAQYEDAQRASGFHNNAFISNGGSNMTVDHNTLFCAADLLANDGGCTSDLSLFGDFDPISNVVINNNLFKANNKSISYCLNGGSNADNGKPYSATGVKVTNNVFERGANSKCGVYGPVTSYSSTASGNTWSGNTWNDGSTLNP